MKFRKKTTVDERCQSENESGKQFTEIEHLPHISRTIWNNL